MRARRALDIVWWWLSLNYQKLFSSDHVSTKKSIISPSLIGFGNLTNGMRRRSSYVASCGIAERWPRFLFVMENAEDSFLFVSPSPLLLVLLVLLLLFKFLHAFLCFSQIANPSLIGLLFLPLLALWSIIKLLPFPSIGCDSKPLPPLLLSLVNKIFGFSAVLRSFCMTESIFLNRWRRRRNRFYYTSSLPVCMRAYLCIGSRNLTTLFAPVPFTRDLSRKTTFRWVFECFTTCLVSQCSAWKRELSRALSRIRHYSTHTTLIKMFAVQQTFATKTVQVNKVNKTTKASFVQDMKKVNKYAPFVLFLRLNLGGNLSLVSFPPLTSIYR